MHTHTDGGETKREPIIQLPININIVKNKTKKGKETDKERDKPTIPCPICRISLVLVVKWAKNLEHAASFVNKEHLIKVSGTKHSSNWKEKVIQQFMSVTSNYYILLKYRLK
jgi:hypothetical protein